MSDELAEMRTQVGAARHAAFDRYVAQARDGSAWSATRHVAPAALKIAGDDVEAFAEILDGVAGVMALVDDGRFEQQAVPVCALDIALARRPIAMRAILAGARTLAELKIEPGWFVQLLVRPLAAAAPEDEAFVTAWQHLIGLAASMARSGQYPGYPIATGLAALVQRGDLFALAIDIELLIPLARAAKDSVYGLFEYGITGLGERELTASETADALRLALAMIDHGLSPGPTLAALGTPVQLDLATRLAKAGVDPRLVITNGVAYFDQLGWLEDGGDRLANLAIELHRRGLRQLLFDDGLDTLPVLERDYGGLALRALELIEAMVARDLEPAIIMRWSLPRTLGWIRPAWAASEILDFAGKLVAHGIEPHPAVDWAVRPLADLATDANDFRRLADMVVALVAGLQTAGIDHRDVLFHDVAHLASAGKESQTFRELLEAFSGLVAAWPGDLAALVKEALPAAAREAAGKPWILATALTSATRLAREGRTAEATTLLEVGVRTITALGEGTELAAGLAAIERRYAELPAELANDASIAAGVLAGTELGKLELALETIALAARAHGAALLAIRTALPDLARMASDAPSLARLIDVAVALPRSLQITSIVAQACKQDPETAARVMTELAAPELAGALGRFGSFGRFVAPAALAACVALVHASFEGLVDKRALAELLAHARTEANLRQMCALVPPLLRDARGPIVDGIYRAHELVSRSPQGWPYLVAPALLTAKQHAGALLAVLGQLPGRFVERPEDAAVIRDLITQRGVRAVDLIANLVAPALWRRVMPSLSQHRELLDRYLREVGFADAEVYEHFVAIATTTDDPAAIGGLRAAIAELTAGIRAGELSPEQRAHPLFGVALQHVFPSAISATRRSWQHLVDTMPERQSDIDAMWPGYRAEPLEVAAGSWQLVAGEHDLAAFAWYARVRPVDDAEPRPAAQLGWELVTAWAEGRLGREREGFARALLAHEDQLPGAALTSAAQLQAIRALAADTLASILELCVLAARAEDGDRVDRLIAMRLAPAPRIGPGLAKAIARTLAADLPIEEKHKRLRGQLAAFELPDDPVAALAGDLEAALHALPAKRIAIEPGKELGRIHADLVGQELAEMTATIARVLEYRASSQIVTLETSLTKRQLHAPIGLAAGVCVASDVELWNRPEFAHLALWLDGVCVGDVHLLVLTEHGERYLALPGINPTYALLDRVEPEVVLAALLARCKELARAAGLAGVWIPTATGIHSNRHSISVAIEKLGLRERATDGHAFSYSPYAYRIERVYEPA